MPTSAIIYDAYTSVLRPMPMGFAADFMYNYILGYCARILQSI